MDDIRFYAYHGVMEQERQVGGEYLVSLAIETDLSEAVHTDDLADTVNYAALYALIEREHVAGRIGQRSLEEFDKIATLTVRVTKQNPPIGADCKGASVEIKMTR